MTAPAGRMEYHKDSKELRLYIIGGFKVTVAHEVAADCGPLLASHWNAEPGLRAALEKCIAQLHSRHVEFHEVARVAVCSTCSDLAEARAALAGMEAPK